MKLKANDVPLAASMIQLAEQALEKGLSSSSAFMCYWTAFVNLYTALAVQSGLRPHFGLRKNGTLRTRHIDMLKMAEVYLPTDKSKLDNVFKHFSEDLKHQLITHPSTRFFVYRTPVWDGHPVKRDAFNQRLNGVINIGATVDVRYPVWSPLNIDLYKQYLHHEETKAKNVLSKQILDLLDTIHFNLLHEFRYLPLAMQAEDENSATVVGKALPLLSLVVSDFIEP